jgi:hypothetical protein
MVSVADTNKVKSNLNCVTHDLEHMCTLAIEKAWKHIFKQYHCTIDLLFDWFGISCMTTYNFCFYLQN